MPPKTKYTREEIVLAALALTRESGFAAVTARGLAARLGCSAKPIFGLFRNMEEVQREVLSAADAIYQQRLAEAMARGELPPYKASGMAYIRFSQEEPELFKLLFMRDRSREEPAAAGSELEELLALIQHNLGLTRQQALLFHLENWVFVHGIAAMAATHYLDWSTEDVSRALTDMYEGLKYRFLKGGRQDESHPDGASQQTI